MGIHRIRIHKKYFFKLLIGMFLAYIVGGSVIPILSEGPYYEHLFLISYGGIPLPVEDWRAYFSLLLDSLLSQLLLTFLLANYMSDDFSTCSVYIFTRSNRKGVWFAQKCTDLFFLVALYYVLQFAVLLFVGRVLARLTISDPAVFWYIVLSELFLTAMLSFCYVLTVNVLSLKMGVHYAYLSSVLLIVIFSALPMLFQNSAAVKFLPFSQSMLIWHDSKKLVPYRDFIGSSIPHFTILSSFLYLLIMIVILLFVGISIVNNMEIMGSERKD